MPFKQSHEYDEREIARIEISARKRAIKASGLGINPFIFRLFVSAIFLIATMIIDPNFEILWANALLIATIFYMGYILYRMGRNYSTLIEAISNQKNYCVSCRKWKPHEDVLLWSDSRARCSDCAEREGAASFAVCFPNEPSE